ncbi:Fatty acid 2-hydroxylase [Globomyces sp. JEL0801]|nr:Fatty acid 2-hydroxylase [Globomyces sp. JEL0801]
MDQVSEHNEKDDAWVVYQGIVYDITDYLEDESHPGGTILISEYFGKDITDIFGVEPHVHSTNAFEQLVFYRIGVLESA